MSRARERGSAMLLAMLVAVALTVIGLSFVLIGETENLIATNERHSAQALHVAETGARVVVSWFDHPSERSALVPFDPGAVDRSLRRIEADGDPATAPVSADGSPASPYYKQGIDRNADGRDDLFDRPYRGTASDALLGTRDGPDLRIDENASAAARRYLADLSQALFPAYPSGVAGRRARLSRIDLFAPPYVVAGGEWTRHGIATIEVTARIYDERRGPAQRILAERTVRVVINEIPYGGAYGPVHSCSDLHLESALRARWGPATSTGTVDLPDAPSAATPGPPRAVPPGPRVDLHFHHGDDAGFADWKSRAQGRDLRDPWFRLLGGGSIVSPTGGGPGTQPWPSVSPASDVEDRSNLFQSFSGTACPELDHGLWRFVAASGRPDTRFFAWAGGATFRENGLGPARGFRDWVDGAEGLLFFDTADGLAPHDDDGDGIEDNLTPPISVSGGTWGYRGWVYVGTSEIVTGDFAGRPVVINAPGEPFQDADANGRFDGGESWDDLDRNGRYDPGEPFDDSDRDGEFDAGENWLNLSYAVDLANPHRVDLTNRLLDDGSLGLFPVRNRRGPPVNSTASIQGVFRTPGRFRSLGEARHYGTVIAGGGFEHTGAAPAPIFVWDETLLDPWPPEDWRLPRVFVTRWENDP
jgi:hypothetical protein